MPKTNSIEYLQPCARFHLDAYTDASSRFAFTTYDHWYGSPDSLTPLDCLAANLLDLRLRNSDIIPLFKSGAGPAVKLREMMQEVLDHTTDSNHFLGLSSIDSKPFNRVRAANVATEDVNNWTAVTVCKVLHRLRPNFVPLYDSVVRAFYGVRESRNAPGKFFERLHTDLRANEAWLTKHADQRLTPDARPLSVLRAADIVIWHHEHEGGCSNQF